MGRGGKCCHFGSEVKSADKSKRKKIVKSKVENSLEDLQKNQPTEVKETHISQHPTQVQYTHAEILVTLLITF